MAITIDGVINFAVPVGILIFIFVLMFQKVREPLLGFFSWVGSKFSSGTDKVKTDMTGEIFYR